MSAPPLTTPPVHDRALRSMSGAVNLTRQSAGGITLDVLRSTSLAVIRITGRVTAAGLRQLRDQLDGLITTGTREVAIQFDEQVCPDSACLQVLHDAQTRLRTRGGQLTATAAGADTQTRLALIGLADGTRAPSPSSPRSS